MNPLNTIQGTLIAGVVIAVVIALVTMGISFNTQSFLVWIHVIAGITWIGLLYYFNFVQVPALAAAAKDQGGPGGAGISKYVAPRALLWFRWGAVVTWLSGAAYLAHAGLFVSAFMLQPGAMLIGVGAWLGTIMLFNVWVLIWPNQKKILGIVPATEEQKATARKAALYASRTNFILSIPMLLCMGGAGHGLPF
jgi:uncharacterized membrane protein